LIIGIDAHNIRGHGGAVNHLYEILNNLNPNEFNIEKIVIWSNKNTLYKLPDKNFIKKVVVPALEKNLLFRLGWQILRLKKNAQNEKCDVLFVPGGIFLSTFKPYVVMAQNLLPFDYEARKIYKGSTKYYKLLFQEKLLKYSFKRAKGIIFISYASRKIILSRFKNLKVKNTVIYHGVSERFFYKGERKQQEKKKILVVADLSLHKGYSNLLKAFVELYEEGLNIKVTIVGGISDSYSQKVLNEIKGLAKKYNFINYLGKIDYNEIHKIYFENEYFIFASHCEAFGMPLVEAMAANMQIACADIPVFMEILRKKDRYFMVENYNSIMNTIKTLIKKNKEDDFSVQISKTFIWQNCNYKTFHFLGDII